MVADRFVFVAAWAGMLVICFAFWAAVFVGLTALLRALGF